MIKPNTNSSDNLQAQVATQVHACYQCGKCSAGCPMAEEMDCLPHQLLRWVQLGRVKRAAASQSIWQCVSCLTCTTRCPQGVDCAAALDTLRQVAARQGLAPPAQQRALLFHKVFLDNIRRNGRLNELELIGAFKTAAFTRDLDVPALMKDALLAPKLMKRGKFHFIGEKVKDRGVVRRIFQRCLNED